MALEAPRPYLLSTFCWSALRTSLLPTRLMALEAPRPIPKPRTKLVVKCPIYRKRALVSAKEPRERALLARAVGAGPLKSPHNTHLKNPFNTHLKSPTNTCRYVLLAQGSLTVAAMPQELGSKGIVA